MAFATLNSIELLAPSSFKESHEVIGGYNTTMTGSKRRYIKAIKKSWNLGYDVLTVEKYDEIISIYNSLIPSGIQLSQPFMVFNITDTSFGVVNEQTHLDISDRQFIPGTNLLSSIEITLTQL
jgi:hypothetical protein